MQGHAEKVRTVTVFIAGTVDREKNIYDSNSAGVLSG